MSGKFKNIIFDCDSTLTKIEGLDEVARRKGIDGEVFRVTAAGMNGDLPFRQSFRRRIELVQPKAEDLIWLGRRYVEEVVEDASKVVKELTANGCRVFILTGGLYPAVRVLAYYLRIDRDRVFAVAFPGFRGFIPFQGINPNNQTDWDRLDTFKAEIVQQIQKTGSTVLVGDGMTDFEAGRAANLFVGFGGVVSRPKLKALCQHYIEEPRLRSVLDVVLL